MGNGFSHSRIGVCSINDLLTFKEQFVHFTSTYIITAHTKYLIIISYITSCIDGYPGLDIYSKLYSPESLATGLMTFRKLLAHSATKEPKLLPRILVTVRVTMLTKTMCRLKEGFS